MPFQLYADESYPGRTVVMAANVAEAKDWAALTDEWNIVLAQPPAIRGPLKMKDADKLRNSFLGFDSEQREAKLRALARVVNRHVKRTILSLVDVPGHLSSAWAKLPYPLSSPIFWAYNHSIIGTAFELWEMGVRERFTAIFDKGNIDAKNAREYYPALVELFAEEQPQIASILPIDPIFETDDDVVALQSAELIAGGARIDMDAATHRFDFIIQEFTAKDFELSAWSRILWSEQVLDHMRGITSIPAKWCRTIDLLRPDSPRFLQKCRDLFPHRFKDFSY